MEGLLLAWVGTQGELNEAEQANIASAYRTLRGGRHPRPRGVLDEMFLRQLHKRMFGQVWQWAGTYRRSDKNIGVPWVRVAEGVRCLCDDVRYWLEDQSPTAWPFERIVVEFHHRLVAIHPFPNGNGRHARLAAELLATGLGVRAPTWGNASLNEASETRASYIQALREADKGDIERLMTFTWS